MKNKKLFVIKKYVWAKSAHDALRLEKKTPADDVWIDEEWKKNSNAPKDAMGFYIENDGDSL